MTTPTSTREQQLIEIVQYALHVLGQMPYQQVAGPIQQIQSRTNEVMAQQTASED